MSSRNVIYGFQVAYPDQNNETVIDSNERAQQIIGKQEKEYKDKLLREERERRLKEMRESGAEIPEGMDADEFLGLADAIAKSEEPEVSQEDIIAEAQAEAERILAEANAQAQEIISAAELNAEALKNIAKQDGYNDGYNQGNQQAALELKESKEEMQAELDRISQEYADATLTLEHDVVEMCLPVFEKVFKAELGGRKEIIYHLLDCCVRGIERTREMLIKVSENNAEYIRSKKEDIQARVGSDVSIDIIADSLFDDSQCVIETDGGIFDCSIDTELESLLREIKALS